MHEITSAHNSDIFQPFHHYHYQSEEKLSQSLKKASLVPIYPLAIKSVLGISLLFGYEVMHWFPEVLWCKPESLVKGFISTPKF